MPTFVLGLSLVGGHSHLVVRLSRRHVLGHEEGGSGAPDDLVGRPAHDALGPLVPARDGAVRGQRDDRIVNRTVDDELGQVEGVVIEPDWIGGIPINAVWFGRGLLGHGKSSVRRIVVLLSYHDPCINRHGRPFSRAPGSDDRPIQVSGNEARPRRVRLCRQPAPGLVSTIRMSLTSPPKGSDRACRR